MPPRDFQQLDFSKLKVTNSGGMALQLATAERWKPGHRLPGLEGYGMTETSAGGLRSTRSRTGAIGTIGIPVPSTECKVIDDDGNELPLGERRRAVHQGPAGDEGLLAAPGGHRRRCSTPTAG
jgi:long-chain acyl-CoA synthetase